MDLSDEFLIKENHIKACGSIQNAVNKAREIAPNKKIELEVETISQFEQALELNVDIVMLDNFDFEQMKQAVKIKEEIKSQTQIEVSGINFCQEEVEKIASLNVDRISIGAITKNCQAIDFSMLATK
jgi:nicotinate-nucleotide pyrophosphorylase (carboxylating)